MTHLETLYAQAREALRTGRLDRAAACVAAAGEALRGPQPPAREEGARTQLSALAAEIRAALVEREARVHALRERRRVAVAFGGAALPEGSLLDQSG